MAHIAAGLLGPDDAARWLLRHPAPAGAEVDRGVAREAVRLARPDALPDMMIGSAEVARAWQARAAALAAYRGHLPPDANLDTVVESLLHMHHNRAVGIDPGHERACRRLARQAAHAVTVRPTAATT